MSGLFRGILNALGIKFSPVGGISATNVQEAIAELDSETVKTTGNQSISGSKTFANTITFVTAPQVSGSAGGSRDFNFSTSGSNRWRFRVNSSPESGSNSGSNFEFLALSDSGALIDSPITIPRASGSITLSRPINITDATASTSTTTGALSVAGGIGITGNLIAGGIVHGRLRTNTLVPANASSDGNAGDIAYDTNYIYVCTATNTWKRSELTTW